MYVTKPAPKTVHKYTFYGYLVKLMLIIIMILLSMFLLLVNRLSDETSMDLHVNTSTSGQCDSNIETHLNVKYI